jgi:hypothetical protein
LSTPPGCFSLWRRLYVPFKEIVKDVGPDGIPLASDVVEVPQSEVDAAKAVYSSGGGCTHEYVKDEDCWPYSIRSCLVCGAGLGLV